MPFLGLTFAFSLLQPPRDYLHPTSTPQNLTSARTSPRRPAPQCLTAWALPPASFSATTTPWTAHLEAGDYRKTFSLTRVFFPLTRRKQSEFGLLLYWPASRCPQGKTVSILASLQTCTAVLVAGVGRKEAEGRGSRRTRKCFHVPPGTLSKRAILKRIHPLKQISDGQWKHCMK